MELPGIGIVPYNDQLAGGQLFRTDSPQNRDDVLQPWRVLRDTANRRGFDLKTWDQLPDAKAVISMDRIVANPPVPWIMIVAEPHVVRPDLYQRIDEIEKAASMVLTHSVDLAARGGKFRHYSLPVGVPTGVQEFPVNNRMQMVMINANKQAVDDRAELYSERLRVAAALASAGKIDVYGPGWGSTMEPYVAPLRIGWQLIRRFLLRREDDLGEQVAYPAVVEAPDYTGSQLLAARMAGRMLKSARRLRRVNRAWRGPAKSKHETLAKYDFCLAFENVISPGYISEKIFDPMFVGTIPIYLGDPLIKETLSGDAFIDYREIGSPSALLEAVTNMSPEEKAQKREAMRDSVRSESFAQRFGLRAWADQLIDSVEAVIS